MQNTGHKVDVISPNKTLSRSLLLLASFVIFTGCASTRLPPGLKAQDLPQVDSQLKEEQVETLVIMGLNDLHGEIFPAQLKTIEPIGVRSLDYKKGGAPLIAGHVNVLRSLYGSRLVILDSGNHLKGSMKTDIVKGEPVIEFYNMIRMDGSALGAHDFSFGPSVLRQRLAEANYPYLAANLRDRHLESFPDLPNLIPSHLFHAGRLKVGLIGIMGVRKTTTHARFTGSVEITEMKTAVVSESRRLKDKGADVIILLANAPISCQPTHPHFQPQENRVWSAHDFQAACDSTSEISQLLAQVPKGTVDAVVTAANHEIVHHWVNGVPVIQSGARGGRYHLIYLPYDLKNKKLLQPLARIEGPIPVCSEIFEGQTHCDEKGTRLGQKRAGKKRGRLIRPQLHGKTITADRDAINLLDRVNEKTRAELDRIVGTASRPIRHEEKVESELGNLVADALREKVKADLSIVNPGSMSGFNIQPGSISYEDIYKAIPHDSSIAVIKVSGRQLKRMMAVLTSGARGFPSVSGMRFSVADFDQSVRSRDLNQNGVVSHWEVDRLKKIRDLQGNRIRNGKIYRVAMTDYLARGGDDLAWMMSKISKSRVDFDAGGKVRDAVIEYIDKNSPVNSLKNPLIDSTQPRVRIIKSRRNRRLRR